MQTTARWLLERKGVEEVENGKRKVNGDRRRLHSAWWTHHSIHRWCNIKLCTWNLYNFINQCHPNKFNTNKTHFLNGKISKAGWTFFMLSEFSEIAKVIFLPANSSRSGATQGLLLSGIFSVPLDSCALWVLLLLLCCCYFHITSFQLVSHYPYPDAWESFSVIIH